MSKNLLSAVLAVACILIFALPAMSIAEDNEKTFYRGWVKLKRDEQMLNAVRIKPGKCNKEVYVFKFWYSGQTTEVQYKKIKSLEWISKLNKTHHGFGSLIRMTLRDGNIYKIHANMCELCLTIIDPFSKQPKTKYIRWREAKHINFLEQLGGIKRCEKDGKEFSPFYIYCPYDGSELKYINWKE